VALFRRGPKGTGASAPAPGTETDSAEAQDGAETTSEAGSSDAAGDAAGAEGPFDVSDVPELGARVDLGAIRVPGVTGMELRMEVDQKTNRVTGAGLSVEGSALQVQAFAAPRTDGIWDEIRAEIAESIVKQGGSVDDVPGPFGRELLARLPARTADGRTGHRPARFIGHDGPRWFLRGVISGKAAVDVEEAKTLESLFRQIVVVRGDDARPPRDLLSLTLPGKRPAEPVVAPPTFDPLTRGPEITEIR